MTQTQRTYTIKEKKYLLEKVARLTHTEHEEIFKIIKMAGTSFTQNKNGLFINLSQMDVETLEKIDNFVEFCLRNKKELDEYDKRIIECKMTNSFDMLASSPHHPSGEQGYNNTNTNTLSERKQLTSLIGVSASNPVKEDWHKVIQQSKEDKKIAMFVNHLEESIDRVQKKKGNMKFANAKKKYARKVGATDKVDLMNVLEEEPYLCMRSGVVPPV